MGRKSKFAPQFGGEQHLRQGQLRAGGLSGALLALLATTTCAPVTLRGLRPTPPVSATKAGLSAELVWIGTEAGSLQVGIKVLAPAGARLERAALVQSVEYGSCTPSQAACDPADSRFTTGTTAQVVGDGPSYSLTFPGFGARRELASDPRLLLDIATASAHTVVELDLSRATFESGNWGMGGALRYRPAGVLGHGVEHMVSGELGAERWLGATRVHLGYEIGFGHCCEEFHRLKSSRVLLPIGGSLRGTHFVRVGDRLTLGLGLGYEALWLLPSDRPPGVPAMLHGPRLSLQFLQTAPKIPRFEDEPPKLATGLELALELLFEDRYEAPRLAPSLAWAYWVVF